MPHIYANTPDDLFFAQGFVHAQDRFFQMEFWRRIGQGRISELFGKGALDQDRFIRTLGWPRVAEQEAAGLTGDFKTVLDSYAAGVNAYALPNASTLSLEFKVLGLNGAGAWKPEPWTPVNTLTWGKAMAFNLGDNADIELTRAAVLAKGGPALADAVMPAYPADHPVIVPSKQARRETPASTAAVVDPAAAVTLARMMRETSAAIGLPHGSDIGSNNWVIAGSKSATGKPILANDPHLGIQMPSIWYQVGLHCRVVNGACPYDVAGVGFAGVPGVIIGHNARIAWGVTNGTVDTQDYFIEKADPANPDAFEYMGRFEPAQIREERINVLGAAAPEVLKVRVTRHGPIMNGVTGSLKDAPPMALSWAALHPGTLIRSVIGLNKARNWEEFRAALRDWDTPSQNVVYADIDGNIGYQFPGNIPVRARGDGSVPVEGWTGANEWTGWIPFEELPSRYNPPEGFIVTANNAVVDAGYPHLLMQRDWDFGFRAQRITDLIKQKDNISVEDIRAIQFDSTSIFAQELLAAVGAAAPAGALSAGAHAILGAWDKRYTRDSQGALLFEMFKLTLARRVFGDELGAGLRDDVLDTGTGTWTALRNVMNNDSAPWWDDATTAAKETRASIMDAALNDAMQALTARFGPDQSKWQWGAAHSAIFDNQTLGKSGVKPIEALFNRGPYPAEGGTGLVNAVGHRASDFSVRSVPSMRMVVDLGDLTRSTLIHTTGQSGHTLHPHYDDMIPLWLKGSTNPMRWSRQDILADAGGTLTLTP